MKRIIPLHLSVALHGSYMEVDKFQVWDLLDMVVPCFKIVTCMFLQDLDPHHIFNTIPNKMDKLKNV